MDRYWLARFFSRQFVNIRQQRFELIGFLMSNFNAEKWRCILFNFFLARIIPPFAIRSPATITLASCTICTMHVYRHAPFNPNSQRKLLDHFIATFTAMLYSCTATASHETNLCIYSYLSILVVPQYNRKSGSDCILGLVSECNENANHVGAAALYLGTKNC